MLVNAFVFALRRTLMCDKSEHSAELADPAYTTQRGELDGTLQ